MCATLGNEFCFLVLLPFIAWNLDMAIGRKMTLLWGIGADSWDAVVSLTEFHESRSHSLTFFCPLCSPLSDNSHACIS